MSTTPASPTTQPTGSGHRSRLFLTGVLTCAALVLTPAAAHAAPRTAAAASSSSGTLVDSTDPRSPRPPRLAASPVLTALPRPVSRPSVATGWSSLHVAAL